MANILLYITVIASWSFTWRAIKYQGGVVPLETSVGYRFFLAGIIFFAWLLIRKNLKSYPPKEHLNMLGQGIMMFAANFIFLYEGAQFISSGLVALTFSMLIFFNIFNGAVFLKKKVENRTIYGALLGFIGMVSVFWQEFHGLESYASTVKGVLLVLLGTYFASLGNIAASRNQAKGIPIVHSNAYGMCYGGIACFLYATLFGGGFAFDPRIEYVGSLLFLTLIGTTLGFSVYLVLLGRIGAEKVAYSLVVVPIVALTIASFTEGYQWTITGLTGIAIIIAGNVLVLWRPRRRNESTVTNMRAANLDKPSKQKIAS